ncbi:MAG TPA: hypothetical protein PLV06_00590 [Bacteroidales bacterium]|nr:hypothetical protein [Bacteroidales bacterium]HPF04012.1 hypothetical protein [Bacteroidales bacterium]HPJ58341.1 hypothetical protein [Bacteroidales bacterium]HPR10853.1 hypothetical protein [Bacteroidales bacterium]HRW84187.1 hypothetical protein [Bacteroidales bacterium]
MKQDSTLQNTIQERPLPKWLTDQRDGLNQYQPEILEMKEDKSLTFSLAFTGIMILFVVVVLSVYVLRKRRKDIV